MCKRLTLAPVVFFTLSAMISSLGFIIGISTGAHSIIIAAALLIVYGIIRDRRFLVAVVITLSLCALASALAGLIWDASYDGMYFHKEAVTALANGWNPLYTPLSDFDPLAGCQDLALWLDNYPKGVWSLYAGFYDISGKIECAKGANILFLLMLFFSAFDTAQSVFGLNRPKSFIVSLGFAVHPVVLSQYFTFYNDLPVAVLIIVCAFGGMKIYAQKADRYDYLCLFCAFLSSFGVKFTAPVFCGAVLLAYGIAFGIRMRGKGLLKPCIIIIASAAVGVCILGADPYIKHIVNGQHPIFPVMGEGKYDIMNTNPPAGFDDISRPKQMMISLFSKAEQDAGASAELKIPFTVHKSELESLAAADVRLGGFGVLFSGILLLSIPLLVICILSRRKYTAAVPALICFATLAVFFPESWWARYNPYTYYIPCLITLWYMTGKKTTVTDAAICLMLVVNTCISASCVYSFLYSETQNIQKKLSEIAAEDKKVLLRINDFPCHAVWFSEAGIDYDIAYTPIDEPQIFYRTTKYKFIDK